MKKVILLSAVILLASSAANAKMYKWTDKSGAVHYSHTLPAEAVESARKEIDGHGNVTKEVDPLAEREAAKNKRENKDQAALELARQEKIKSDKQEKLAELQKRDDYLLTTYNNKDELVSYFENKIKMVKGNSNIYETYNSVLVKRISKLERKKKVTKHKATLASIEKKISDINNSIAKYNKALAVNSEEIVKLNSNYQVDKKRYAELTSK